MANPQKSKGDEAELEVQGIIRDLTGWPARRMLGAGRLDDVGDIDGVPSTVIQVANWKDVAALVREKPEQAEQQRARAAATFACTWARFPRLPLERRWRVVLTPEQWATYARESARP